MKRALIVEDHVTVASVFEVILGRLGWEVRHAPTLAIANALIFEQPFRIALVDRYLRADEVTTDTTWWAQLYSITTKTIVAQVSGGPSDLWMGPMLLKPVVEPGGLKTFVEYLDHLADLEQTP